MFYSVRNRYNSDEISKRILQLFVSWQIAAMLVTIGLYFLMVNQSNSNFNKQKHG
jgi:hypothetical protein